MADNGEADEQEPIDEEGMLIIHGDADNGPIDVDAIPAPPPPPPSNPVPPHVTNFPNAELQTPQVGAGPVAPAGPLQPDDDPAETDPNPHTAVSDSEPDLSDSEFPPGHCAELCHPRWLRIKSRSHWRKGLCQGLRGQRDVYRQKWRDRGRFIRSQQGRLRDLEETVARLQGRRRLKTAPVSLWKCLRGGLLTHKHADLATRIAARKRNRTGLQVMLSRRKQFTSLTP